MKFPIEQAAGAGSIVTLGGKQLKLSPLAPVDLAEAKVYYKNQSENPLEVVKRALPGFPPELQKILVEKAYEDFREWGTFNSKQGKDWLVSISGFSFMTWLSLRKTQPEITLDWVIQQLTGQTLEKLGEIQDKFDLANGMGNNRGNSHGSKHKSIASAKTKRRAKQVKKAKKRAQTTPISISNSEVNTHGPVGK